MHGKNRRIGKSEMSILEILGRILPYNLERRWELTWLQKTFFFKRKQFFWVYLNTIQSYTLRVSNYPVSLGKWAKHWAIQLHHLPSECLTHPRCFNSALGASKKQKRRWSRNDLFILWIERGLKNPSFSRARGFRGANLTFTNKASPILLVVICGCPKNHSERSVGDVESPPTQECQFVGNEDLQKHSGKLTYRQAFQVPKMDVLTYISCM